MTDIIASSFILVSYFKWQPKLIFCVLIAIAQRAERRKSLVLRRPCHHAVGGKQIRISSLILENDPRVLR